MASPLLVALVGGALTLILWWRALEEGRKQEAAAFHAVAEESHSVLRRSVEQHISALRNLAKFWQLFGLLPEGPWRYNTEMLLAHFHGLAWVAWVDRHGEDFRYAALDSSRRLPESVVRAAQELSARPGEEAVYPERTGEEVHFFIPVRTPEDSIGVLAAALRPDSLLGGLPLRSARILAYRVRSEAGQEIFRGGTPAPDAPSWLKIQLELASGADRKWHVEYEPTGDYLPTASQRWSLSLLLAGFLLSLAVSAIAFQFLRLRDVSAALARTNRELDVQIQELSLRDAELRRVNEELEARVEARTLELREAMKELEAFSHSVSHDLRSPVGAVLNVTGILEEDFGERLGEEGVRLLRRARASGELATRLLDELAQFAWVGRGDIQCARVDMAEAAREAFAEAVAGSDADRKVALAVGELPAAWADRTLVGRVFANLFSNALKFTRAREAPRIVVTGFAGETENTYEVADNGIGFDPTHADALFEPFRRLHASKDYQGTGLGLAIVAKIVRKQGGRIWAESDGTTGAQFRFTLPAEDRRA